MTQEQNTEAQPRNIQSERKTLARNVLNSRKERAALLAKYESSSAQFRAMREQYSALEAEVNDDWRKYNESGKTVDAAVQDYLKHVAEEIEDTPVEELEASLADS